MRNESRLLVFLRAPREGQVKTRLAREIGPVAALEAYRTLLQRTLDAAADFGAVELRFTPADSLPLVEPLLRPGWTAVAQGEGDLGVRLDSAFRDAFRDGFQRVMVVGSDCPEIGPEDLSQADERLSETDVVLGPAQDGGYWLLGLRRPASFLFRDMPWSTPGVFAETVRRVESAGLRLGRLRELADVDTAADWRRWLERARPG
jgi:hypothetical protein